MFFQLFSNWIYTLWKVKNFALAEVVLRHKWCNFILKGALKSCSQHKVWDKIASATFTLIFSKISWNFTKLLCFLRSHGCEDIFDGSSDILLNDLKHLMTKSYRFFHNLLALSICWWVSAITTPNLSPVFISLIAWWLALLPHSRKVPQAQALFWTWGKFCEDFALCSPVWVGFPPTLHKHAWQAAFRLRSYLQKRRDPNNICLLVK